VSIAAASTASAQTPAQPPAAAPTTEPPSPLWTGSAGLGFTMNRGNTSTTNFNVTFDASTDAKKKDVFKTKVIYLRDEADGAVSANRTLFDARYERTISNRLFGYAGVGFLSDEFKDIEYLWAPAAGLGYKLVVTETTTFNVDAGLGVKVEKNPDVDATTDVAITLSDKFEHKLSKEAKLTQGFTALWTADDFGDAVYTFTAGIAAALTTRTQVKVELLNAYMTRPPSADVKKNDVLLITSFGYKF
jgi:putative salt-induced outer membrane protein YdiY